MSFWLSKRNLFKRFYRSASELYAYFTSFPKTAENLSLAERLLDCNGELHKQYLKSGVTFEFQTWWRVYHWEVRETFRDVPKRITRNRGNRTVVCQGVRTLEIHCTWQAAPWRRTFADKLPVIIFTCICLVIFYFLHQYFLYVLAGGE